MLYRLQDARPKALVKTPARGASSSSAHTYRLRIFKERWLRGEDLNL
jgi:hypothetical protein